MHYNHDETTRNEINAAENQRKAPRKHHVLRTPTHTAHGTRSTLLRVLRDGLHVLRPMIGLHVRACRRALRNPRSETFGPKGLAILGVS